VANFDDNTMSVLINTTSTGSVTASFTAQQVFSAGNEPQSIAAGDINGDGLPIWWWPASAITLCRCCSTPLSIRYHGELRCGTGLTAATLAHGERRDVNGMACPTSWSRRG